MQPRDVAATDVFLDETAALLERMPRVLHALLGGLPESWLDGRDRPTAGNPAMSSAT